ncbi:MAG: hypothetical protein KDE58_33320 [Caldilineaceae bacterium]|nr:hypothetical protein [Caldilineaceae bacterium]
MRLAIVGKTRSGKSTALHRFLSHALRHPWAGVILLDGKGSELCAYANLPGVRYFGPDAVVSWAAALNAHAEQMMVRYSAIVARGLRSAPLTDPRYLIIIDEVQKGTRHAQMGKHIKNDLTHITEQSAALNDVIVVATQREINAMPPSARHNVNVWLRMLGKGYYYLQADERPTTSGRTGYLTPDEALVQIGSGEAPLSLEIDNLGAILGTQGVTQTRAPATLYVGAAGSGKTWHLEHHRPRQKVARQIYVDLSQPQRQALVQLIEAAGAAAPPHATIPQLAAMSALALQSVPTLLLLDNVDRATEKAIKTIEPLIEAVSECALAAKTAQRPAEQRKLAPLVSRVAKCEIKPLERSDALSLVRKHLPDRVVDPQATERRILELGKGHPATIVDLATRTQRGTLEEVRNYESTQITPINLGWMLIFPLFFLLLLWRADGYMIAALSMLAIMVLRRLLFRQLMR